MNPSNPHPPAKLDRSLLLALMMECELQAARGVAPLKDWRPVPSGSTLIGITGHMLARVVRRAYPDGRYDIFQPHFPEVPATCLIAGQLFAESLLRMEADELFAHELAEAKADAVRVAWLMRRCQLRISHRGWEMDTSSLTSRFHEDHHRTLGPTTAPPQSYFTEQDRAAIDAAIAPEDRKQPDKAPDIPSATPNQTKEN